MPQYVLEYCREQFVSSREGPECSKNVVECSKSVVEFPGQVFFCPVETLACSNKIAECSGTMLGWFREMYVSSGEKHWFSGNKLVSPWKVLVEHREALRVSRKMPGCPWNCLCTLRRCYSAQRRCLDTPGTCLGAPVLHFLAPN